jgi:O-antigen ligase
VALISRLGATRPLAHAGWFVLVFLAVFFGLASAVLPGWFVFSVLLVPAVAALMLVRPEYALTACAALVCGLIHPALVPRIPAFGGALAAADAALAMLAIYAAWSFAAQPRSAALTPVPGARFLAVALGLFGACFAIAVVASLSLRDLNPTFVFGETRDLMYLILLPIAVLILRQPERQERFVLSFVVLGCLFSVGQVLQGVFNIPVFGAQGMSALETLGRLDDATTRANTLGLNVIVFSLLLTVGAYALGAIRKPLFFAAAGLLFVGIVLTFGRTTFAAVFICVALVVWWLDARKLPQLMGVLVIAVTIGSALGWYWKPESFASVVYRMTSIGEEIDHGYSAQWRIWEVESMLPHIRQHPLAGIGLGADYKGASGSTIRPELNRYMHNAYLYMAGKMGLPALGFFLLAMAAMFAIGRRTAKSDALPWSRIVGAASAAMMIRFLFASVTEPHLMSDYGVVVIAIAGALAYLSAQRAATARSSQRR